MDYVIKSKAVVYDYDDISTDQIYPGKYINLFEPAEIAEHVLEGADVTLKERFKTGHIFVAGNNFGCGSSREHAVISLKASGVKLVITSAPGRIWYRNAINLALPVMICPELSKKVVEGDELEVNLRSGEIKNLTQNSIYQGEPLPEFIMNIIENGGIKQMMLKKNS